MTTEKNLLISLRGFDVYSGRTYRIVNKPDNNAPSALREMGATKIPTADGGDVFQFPFKRYGEDGSGVWDTGFYAESPCYQNMSEEDKKANLKRAQEILKKYRAATGISHMFDHKTPEGRETLDRAMFAIKYDDFLSSDNAQHLMTMYVALFTANVANKEEEEHPQFNEASYSIVDTTKAVKDADEKTNIAFEVIKVFLDKIKTPDGKKTLIQVLNYLGIAVIKDINDEALQTIALNRVAQEQSLAKRFFSVMKDMDTERGRFTVEVFTKLREIEGKGLGLVKEPKKGYYYKGVMIGQDLRRSAESIVNNKDLNDIKCELLDIEVPTEE